MKPMTVATGSGVVSIIIESAARETTPHSLYREVTKNGIEACQARLAIDPSMFGNLFVDCDWEQDGDRRLLRVTDNGIGFDPQTFERYINTVHQSGKSRGLNENFGIGLKIGLYHSPDGVLIRSIGDKNVEGVMATLMRSPEGIYGLESEVINGEEVSCRHIPTEMRDDTVMFDARLSGAPRGTSVTYFGGGAQFSGNTFQHAQLCQSLGLRYFRLPDGITLRVRRPRHDSRESQWNHIIGLQQMLERHCSASGEPGRTEQDCGYGSVRLSDATVHWYVFPALNVDRRFTIGTGQPPCAQYGVIYQDESYNQRSGQLASRMANQFGIRAIDSRVALFVEPDNHMTISMSRTKVSFEGCDHIQEQETRWAMEFRRVMPPQLKQMCDAEMSRLLSTGGDRRERLLKELKRLKALETPKYKPDSLGTFTAATAEGTVPNDVIEDTCDGSSEPGVLLPRRKRKTALRDRVKDAKPVKPHGADHSCPKICWCTPSDRPTLHGHAGEYDSFNGDVFLNSEWADFVQCMQELQDKNPTLEEAVIAEEHKFQVELHCVCALSRSRTLAATDETKADLLSPKGFSIGMKFGFLSIFDACCARLHKLGYKS